jgi:CubicO group peptidase (beta-lactamase class C family)
MTDSQFPIPHFTDPDRLRKLRTAFPQAEETFARFFEQRRVPGLSFGIVIDGELVYAGGFGVQNIDTKIPVTPHSVFRIASMTKSFTAMCIVKLRDEGKLRLDDPVADYVPELASLPYPTRDSAPITVRQLLTMSVGFPQDDPWADRQLGEDDAVVSEWMRGGISFSNAPGVTFEYSNYAYAILGRIVTNVSGMPYQRYAVQNILAPLGMASTTFDVDEVAPDRLAMGYRFDGDGWAEEPPLRDGAFAPMGGLFTTITDFARYMAFLLSAFPPRDDAETGPIRRNSAREMQQIARYSGVSSFRRTPDSPPFVISSGYGYGLGCSFDSTLGYTVAHGGGLPGYGTFYRLLPDCGVGVVAFSNLTYAPAGMAVGDVLNALQKTDGLKPRKLSPSPVLTDTRDRLTRLIEQWDDQAAAALATETFFQDMPMDKRREQFERLRADLGACQSVTDIQPENALRGRWTLQCERGWINVFATLSPTVPPRLQYLYLSMGKPLTPALNRTVFRLVRLMREWDDKAFRSLCALQVKRADLRSQFEALRMQYGDLQIGDVLEGDGTTHTRIRLFSPRGALEAYLAVDPQSGKIREVSFSRSRETPFTL